MLDDLTVALADKYHKIFKEVLKNIANSKMMDADELVENYLPNKSFFNKETNDLIQKKKKKSNRRRLPDNERCLGRKIDCTQCTRKRKDNSLFCISHQKNLPNGMIGDDGECFNKKKGKRGRKRKKIIVNTDEYILTTKHYIENKIYLKDNNDFIIMYNDNDSRPIIKGKLIDGKIIPIEEYFQDK